MHILCILPLAFFPLILPCNGPCFDRPSRRSGVCVSNFPRTRASRVTLAHCGHCRRAVSIQPSGLNHFNEFPRAGCTIIEKILLFHCFHESAPSLHGSSNKSHNGSNTTPMASRRAQNAPQGFQDGPDTPLRKSWSEALSSRSCSSSSIAHASP